MPRTANSKHWLPLFVALALVALMSVGIGPCGRVAGGALWGEEARAPVADWSFANNVQHCQVEVRPANPHSVTVNCMSGGGRLFVSCSRCAGKKWSKLALADSNARIRIGETIYPVKITRVTGAAELDRVWQIRAKKLGREPSPRPQGWWTFELNSR